MSGLIATARPYRIKAAHRRRRKVASGQSVQRYYDPLVGRFLSVDPVTANGNSGENFNRYWYADNNPYMYVDPDGRDVKFKNDDVEREVRKAAEGSQIITEQLRILDAPGQVHYVGRESAPVNGQSNVNAANPGDAQQLSDGSSGPGSGSVILIKLEPEFVDIIDPVSGKLTPTEVPIGEKIAHEFEHAVTIDEGMLIPDPKQQDLNEPRARGVENFYRKEQGLQGKRPLR